MSRKRLIWTAALCAVALLAIGVAYWVVTGPLAYARIATGYAAQQTCACLHVSGRALDQCVLDFPEDARAQFNIEIEDDIVRASVLGGAISASAQNEGEFGCRLLD